MTIKEAFKVGFLTEMARRGITPDTFNTMIEKRAAGAPSGSGKGFGAALVKGMGGALGTIGSGALNIGGGIGKGLLVGIPATAALGGWMVGSQDEVGKEDIKSLEQMALIHEYENALRNMQKSDESHGHKRRRLPTAGQSTQSVIQPQMAKVAVAPVVPVAQPAPLVTTDNQPIRNNIEKAKKVLPKLAVPAKPVAMKG